MKFNITCHSIKLYKILSSIKVGIIQKVNLIYKTTNFGLGTGYGIELAGVSQKILQILLSYLSNFIL